MSFFSNCAVSGRVGLQRSILARLMWCARLLCDELKNNREDRELQPMSTPSVSVAVIHPYQHCLFYQLSFAWNE